MQPTKLIKPSHIDTTKHFFNAFDNSEREFSANWIVRFCCQENNDSWEPFPVERLQAFYQKGFSEERKFFFNGLEDIYLNEPKHGIQIEGDRVIVHDKFVAACYKSSWKG